jgi:hypothetical protein
MESFSPRNELLYCDTQFLSPSRVFASAAGRKTLPFASSAEDSYTTGNVYSHNTMPAKSPSMAACTADIQEILEQ